MKHIFRFVSVLLCICLLSACSHRPANETTADSPENVSGDFDTISLAALSENKAQEIEKILNFQCDNLILPETLDFTVPEEIGKYQIMCIGDFQENADMLFQHYIPKDQLERGTITDDDRTYPLGPLFNDETTGMYVATGCTGFFTYAKNSSSAILDALYSPDELSTIACYFQNNSYKNDTYDLKDGTIDINHAVSLSADFVSDFEEITDYATDLQPHVATVYQSASKENVIYIGFSPIYRDLPINTMPLHINPDDLSFDMYILGYAVVYLDETNNINTFTSQAAFSDYNTIKTYDSIISPESALQLFSEKLSGYSERQIIGMELLYCPAYVTSIDEGQDGFFHREKAPWANTCSYDIFELTPYWAVYFDVTPTKEIYGLVNCITGEVDFVDNHDRG